MNLTKATLASVLLAAMLLAMQESMAQFGGGFPGGASTGGGMRGGRGSQGSIPRDQQRPAMQENIADQVEYRMDLLQEDLKLRPEQYNPWVAYADKVKALAADIARERGRTVPMTSGNALQQIDQIVNAARNRLTALEDVASVAKVLYDSLAPEQKLLADSRIAMIIPAAAGFAPAAVSEMRNRPGGAP